MKHPLRHSDERMNVPKRELTTWWLWTLRPRAGPVQR